MRFKPLVISLPLIFSAAFLTQQTSSASAAAMSPAEATELLARSHAINIKCSVLSADESQSLRDLLARAEISLAEKASVTAAKKSIAAGKASGLSAVCDDASRSVVKGVFTAAKNALTSEPIAQEDITQAEPQPEPEPAPVVVAEKPVVAKKVAKPETTVALAVPLATIKKKTIIAKAAPIAKIEKPKAVAALSGKPMKTAKGLGDYGLVAEKYYAARKCGDMSAGEIAGLYQVVLAKHQDAMARNKPGAVRAILRTAEARANKKSCG
jgi:hypothetical protein